MCKIVQRTVSLFGVQTATIPQNTTVQMTSTLSVVGGEPGEGDGMAGRVMLRAQDVSVVNRPRRGALYPTLLLGRAMTSTGPWHHHAKSLPQGRVVQRHCGVRVFGGVLHHQHPLLYHLLDITDIWRHHISCSGPPPILARGTARNNAKISDIGGM